MEVAGQPIKSWEQMLEATVLARTNVLPVVIERGGVGDGSLPPYSRFRGTEAQGTLYSNASESDESKGAGKPGSRPQNCVSTTEPVVRRNWAGVPPSNPCANVFMSRA